MRHLGCGGEIYWEFTQTSYMGLYTDTEGKPGDVAYDHPYSEVEDDHYKCQVCEKVWLTQEELLAENRSPSESN